MTAHWHSLLCTAAIAPLPLIFNSVYLPHSYECKCQMILQRKTHPGRISSTPLYDRVLSFFFIIDGKNEARHCSGLGLEFKPSFKSSRNLTYFAASSVPGIQAARVVLTGSLRSCCDIMATVLCVSGSLYGSRQRSWVEVHIALIL